MSTPRSVSMTWTKLRELRRCFSSSCRLAGPRLNEVNIQCLSDSLHKQVFGECEANVKRDKDEQTKRMSKIRRHLETHELWGRSTTEEKEVEFTLPPFEGKDIDEHFRILANNQIKDYLEFIERYVAIELPKQPTEWKYVAGWTKYDDTGQGVAVDCPEDDIFVFDVETVVKEGNYPAMAVAMSENCWYSWCSKNLVDDVYRWSHDVLIDDLIPLEGPGARTDGVKKRKVAIGHNVAFDRSFVKEQYYIEKSKLRFLDTMSMHIATCGLTSFQRVLYQANRKNSNIKVVSEFKEKQRKRGVIPVDDWMDISSLNNLKDVHMLHVGGKPLDKDPRDLFVKGSSQDVRDNFQDCMKYAAQDVLATFEVFRALWPDYKHRFPHPVTMAGMFEMGTGYLPVNENWERYINQANTVYDDIQLELKEILIKLANEACQYLENDRYKDDPWLWDLDWSVQELKVKKTKPPTIKKTTKKGQQETEVTQEVEADEDDSCIDEVLKKQESHYKNTGQLIGYPKWYRELTEKQSSEDWGPGPSKISSLTRVTPKILRLTWDGYPLHYDEKHGWGYLVPGRTDNLLLLKEPSQDVNAEDGDADETEAMLTSKFPYRQMCEILECAKDIDKDSIDDKIEELEGELLADDDFELKMNIELNKDDMSNTDHGQWDDKKDYSQPPKRVRNSECPHKGDGPHKSVNLPGCWFFKIPHKDGAGKRVGNPLSKDYLEMFKDGTMKAMVGGKGEHVIRIHKYCSYWKNAQKRIQTQMNVWLNEEDIPDIVKKKPGYTEGRNLGAIVPRIVSAGTITRRAVEPTWLTASNAYADRIGSELKAMVQAPPGYSFVGADVDSQELWIAALADRIGSELKAMVQAPPGYSFVGADVDSQELWIGALLGDAHFGQTHGCTGLGWMTLQGNKKDKTDLHSKVAATVDISRDQAKVFNYGRIYGAGQRFAEKLLLQFNHRLTKREAQQKAQIMYHTTKGKKCESAMFNKLEAIATNGIPHTPVLGCKISKALEPTNVENEFITSRINWVVQSSAVDYLHLMLVCMNWLFEKYDINGRFCISIHDEVRYFVAEEDRYRAALALQITNLLTRSMFSYKCGIKDLPLSVAFFSAVDIDKCLRKEVNLSCKTPSNPFGLERGYQIQEGEALDIHEILEKTGGSLEKPVDGITDTNESQEDRVARSTTEADQSDMTDSRLFDIVLPNEDKGVDNTVVVGDTEEKLDDVKINIKVSSMP